MNFVIVCGGTGGHLFPGIAVGEELLRHQHQVMLIISEKEVDQRAVQHAQGFLIETLPAVGWRGVRPDYVARFCGMMLKSYQKTKKIYQSFPPDAVLGMGGFSSVTPLLVAKQKGIPSCIHESNVIPGKANRMAAKLASAVAIGVEEARPQFGSAKVICTGTPVRGELRVRLEKAKAKEELGLNQEAPVILAMGGSQGARGLNRVVLDAARSISKPQIQWIHLTGTTEENAVREGYVKIQKNARIYPFCHDMRRLYAAADLIIARSGASSLTEIAEWGIPSILVPYPFAAENHQSANATVFANTGAGIKIEESDCTPDRLRREITQILESETVLNKMVEATKKLRHENAHEKLAKLVEGLAADKNNHISK
jgi:UDP-N-acetylglucosamine--N-acetylmuramyl-(pentapeptide) pyrophosphoryl-undecaprenol N-acetylglucosamine transferase